MSNENLEHLTKNELIEKIKVLQLNCEILKERQNPLLNGIISSRNILKASIDANVVDEQLIEHVLTILYGSTAT